MKRLLLLPVFLLCALPTAATTRVAIRVTPTFAFAPATVHVVATIAPDDETRAIEVVAESDAYYRSSTVPLDGEDAPRSSRFEFRRLPQGVYNVTATLIDAAGRHTVVRRQIRIE